MFFHPSVGVVNQEVKLAGLLLLDPLEQLLHLDNDHPWFLSWFSWKWFFPPLHLRRGPFELSLQYLPLPVVVDGVSVLQWTWGHGESPLGTWGHGDMGTWGQCYTLIALHNGQSSSLARAHVWQLDNVKKGVTLWHGDMGTWVYLDLLGTVLQVGEGPPSDINCCSSSSKLQRDPWNVSATVSIRINCM